MRFLRQLHVCTCSTVIQNQFNYFFEDENHWNSAPARTNLARGKGGACEPRTSRLQDQWLNHKAKRHQDNIL